jgi:uncharacterized protein YyaL (SSP411 family)
LPIVNYPTSFANWGSLILKLFYGFNEIVITGSDYRETRNSFLEKYIPNRIFLSSGKEVNEFSLLRGKNYRNYRSIYLCKDNRCLPPVETLEDLYLRLSNLGNIDPD